MMVTQPDNRAFAIGQQTKIEISSATTADVTGMGMRQGQDRNKNQ